VKFYGSSHRKPDVIHLGLGDLLLLYTDGVTEARRDRQLFGSERLQRLMSRKRISAERLPDLVLDRVLAFSGGTLRDDVAMLALMCTI
jgi:sigma-B regulation protein RsbU (phosphoserine phosphatase)